MSRLQLWSASTALLLAACSQEPAAVYELDTGVRVEVLEEGSGPKPDDGRYVAIEFEAFLAADGSSLGTNPEGEPFIFRLVDDGTSIPGLRDAVRVLSEGARARVEIPAARAYADVGKHPIPANADLVYELTLTHIFERSPSGLQYVVLDPGQGPRVGDDDHVVIEYRGILLETGREFASSRKRHRPEEFKLGQGLALPAWEEGLRLLGRGGHCWLAVPPALGYGDTGRLPVVPPGVDLLYDLHLKGVRNLPDPARNQRSP